MQVTSILYLWDVSHSNLQHLLQKVDVSAGALRAVLQGLAPQFLAHFWVVSCLLEGWENKGHKNCSHWNFKIYPRSRYRYKSENVQFYMLICTLSSANHKLNSQLIKTRILDTFFVMPWFPKAQPTMLCILFYLVTSALQSLKDILTDAPLHDFEKWLSHYQRVQP